jgi:uncharacterized protein YdaT
MYTGSSDYYPVRAQKAEDWSDVPSKEEIRRVQRYSFLSKKA